MTKKKNRRAKAGAAKSKRQHGFSENIVTDETGYTVSFSSNLEAPAKQGYRKLALYKLVRVIEADPVSYSEVYSAK